jgi:hypothetical protein
MALFSNAFSSFLAGNEFLPLRRASFNSGLFSIYSVNSALEISSFSAIYISVMPSRAHNSTAHMNGLSGISIFMPSPWDCY